MLNPIWLKTFATVATSRSFTEAGRRLGLTQSSVSDHIRRLEESTGRRLFVRDTHSLALTADGESLLVHARLILEAHARARAPFKKYASCMHIPDIHTYVRVTSDPLKI